MQDFITESCVGGCLTELARLSVKVDSLTKLISDVAATTTVGQVRLNRMLTDSKTKEYVVPIHPVAGGEWTTEMISAAVHWLKAERDMMAVTLDQLTPLCESVKAEMQK